MADRFEASLQAAQGAAGADVEQTGICRFGWSCEAWTDGVIGYSYANDWGSESANATMRGRIAAAMAHWTARTGMR